MAARQFTALVAFTAGLAWAGSAAAFCRTTTCDPNSDCQYDANGCAVNGIPLSWPTPCVSFGLQEDASPLRNIGFDEAESIITNAYARWIGARCDGGNPSLEVSYFGPIECGEPEYNQTAGNANVWMFRDTDWPYEGQFSTLALTTITFNFETGDIFDADVEVNSTEVALTTSDEGVQFDLDSIVTHETGHFMGLSHSREPGATMDAGYQAGSTSLRTLSPDDEAGVCAIYPPDRAPPRGDCVPRHGFSEQCGGEPDGGGCSFGMSSAPPWRSGGLFAAALVAGWLCRRRRRSA